MLFGRLVRLGPEKFSRIVNELMRGTPAATVAKLVHEWRDALDVRPDTLAKQLTRLHTAISQGAFGVGLADQARRAGSVRIKLLRESSVDCLERIIELSILQRERVEELYLRERRSGKVYRSVTVAMREYAKTLELLQKIRFDLGLDEYKRGFPPADPWQQAEARAKEQRALYDAYVRMHALINGLPAIKSAAPSNDA